MKKLKIFEDASSDFDLNEILEYVNIFPTNPSEFRYENQMILLKELVDLFSEFADLIDDIRRMPLHEINVESAKKEIKEVWNIMSPKAQETVYSEFRSRFIDF